ncbi:MAG TPA: hypothetical protein VEC15_13720 [Actinomycetota bacterium]|nr:hypothetical protein [Actinomycetota bacterium]
MDRSRAAVRGSGVLVLAIVAACSSGAAPRCPPVAEAYRSVLVEALGRVPVRGEPVSRPSRVDGAWYIVAVVDAGAAVWVSDRDPSRGDVHRLVTANRLAQRLSDPDVLDFPLSFSESAQAAGDLDGIAAAVTACG